MVCMAPTRELAMQIATVLVDAGEKCNTRCVCIYGGVPKKDQVDALRRGVEIVVGTPGRLEDLMNEGSCKLNVSDGGGGTGGGVRAVGRGRSEKGCGGCGGGL